MAIRQCRHLDRQAHTWMSRQGHSDKRKTKAKGKYQAQNRAETSVCTLDIRLLEAPNYKLVSF